MGMKKTLLLQIFTFFCFHGFAQNFSGQWKGGFVDQSTSFSGFGGDACDYVLELECKGKEVSGSSYTYFTDGGKKYYTICRLRGFIDTKQKYIEVREVERTKTNVPVNIRNCFQVHKLTYFKKGDSAILKGNWEPAPNQDGDCGIGSTLLVRRELKSNIPGFNAGAPKSRPLTKGLVATAPAKKPAQPPLAANKKSKKPTAKVQAKPARKSPPIAQKSLTLNDTDRKPVDSGFDAKISPGEIVAPGPRFEKRNNTVLKTIQVDNKTVRVDLYDNGEIDGDSISLFYNGKLLMSSKRLSDKPITLTINVDDNTVNELVMYAENLGTISPNTALMVVTDGPKRYEVRITSDLQKSGVINFIHKPS